jgi:DNA-binding transcriptional ArsR family regulator
LDSFQQLLWWLFQSSTGGPSRVRLVQALREEPRNAQQLSVALDLDYTTVRHHLKVLQQNRLIETRGDRYGQVYFVAPGLESRWALLEAIVTRDRARSPGVRK